MAFRVEQNPNGTATLYENGERISTGTPDYINSIAQSPSSTVTPTAAPYTPQKLPVSVFSSPSGQEEIDKVREEITPPSSVSTTTPKEKTPLPTPEDQLFQQQIDEGESSLKAGAKANKAIVNSIFEPHLNSLPEQKRQQIASINAIFDTQERLLEEANRRYEKTIETAGIRGGVSRYSPETQAGITRAEQQASALRIGELNARRQQAIAQIESDFADKEFSLGYQKYQELKK